MKRGPNWSVCAGRTSNSSWNGKSWPKPPPGSLGRPTRSHPSLRVRERQPGCVSDPPHEPCAGSLAQRVLYLAETTTVETRAGRRSADPGDQEDPPEIER